MSEREQKYRFDPKQPANFRLSRNRLDMYVRCPRCFYLNMRYRVKPPDGFPFTLNSAVDTLLKREFDLYRNLALPHPLMQRFGICGYPYSHPDLEKWRFQ